ncbi:MAG: NAD-dependent succinate-semialdehyde dehydrogenase [bacterium]|jgi:succinate-semialdehyde dehydrogenase/glutarate-semialdehyde dehydrogenase|nr:NAD-dependent succinate-semialdehyde dehydrogenase [Betaproteobacteria bacterium]
MKESLKNPDLLRQQALVDGVWSDADSNATLEVFDPADGHRIGTVPDMGATDTQRAILAASAAFPGWRDRLAGDRAAIMKRWHALVLENQQDLAVLMTLEQGRPQSEARGEVAYAATFIEWFAEEGKRVYGDLIRPSQRDSRTMVMKEPVGVCAAITPWNFPAAMVTRKVAPALAAGCTIVLKPAEQTPYTALALASLALQAGVPPGVFNVVTGTPEPIGRELTANRLVRKVTFTGSTDVGKLLLRQCADTVKKVSLELGGNSPFLIFDDADLDAAAEGAVACKFRNTGQTCVCANRILVQDGVYEAFVQRFAARVAALKVGNGFEPGVQQGPLIDHSAVERLEMHVDDALRGGARIVHGGRRHWLGGNFFEPTVLADCTPAMRVSQEEIFGPVAPISAFATEAEAVALANDTEYGLAAYVYTRDLGRMFRVSEALEVGVVGVNKAVFATEVAPFGGRKQSGIGMEGSKYGIEEYLLLKRLTIGGVD